MAAACRHRGAVALRKFDRVAILSHDESWMAEAIVGAATATNVTLAGIRKTDLPARLVCCRRRTSSMSRGAETATAVERKRDGLRVSDVVPTIYEATRHMTNRYSHPGA